MFIIPLLMKALCSFLPRETGAFFAHNRLVKLFFTEAIHKCYGFVNIRKFEGP
jgi:hypothetical protein